MALKTFVNDATLWKLYSDLYFSKLNALTVKLSDLKDKLCEMPDSSDDDEDEDEDIDIDIELNSNKNKNSEKEKIKTEINKTKKLMNSYYIQSIAACKKGIDSVLSPKDSGLLWHQMIDIVLSKLVSISQQLDEVSNSDDKKNENTRNILQQLKNKQIKVVENIFKQSIQQCSMHDSLKMSYLDWISIYFVNNANNSIYAFNNVLKELRWFAMETIHCNQNVYQMIFSIYDRLFMVCSQFKQNESIKQASKSQIIRTFERCIADHGKYSADVWIWYLQWARKNMIVSQSSLIYKRAMRSLNKFESQRFLHAMRSSQ